MSASTLYTVGTALNRARSHETLVSVLVCGQWLQGTVMDVDGHGVILANQNVEHSVIRIEAVTAVRIHSQAPTTSQAALRAAEDMDDLSARA